YLRQRSDAGHSKRLADDRASQVFATVLHFLASCLLHLHCAIRSTTRKRALPLIMRSQASSILSIGYSSFIDRTPVSELKPIVSCESIDVPEYQPFTDSFDKSSCTGDTVNGCAAPRISSVPLGASP